MKRYFLRVIAPDGEIKTERGPSHEGFYSIEEAWKESGNMGSRWFFYPIHVVTGATEGKSARLVSVPDGCRKHWEGKSLKTFCDVIARHESEICDALNEGYPLSFVID